MANVGYIRVSSVQQNTERQLDGETLDKVFTEKVSGKNAEREQLKAMLDYVREGDTVHVHELSRLGRNVKDLLEIIDTLKEKGVTVHFHKERLTVGAESNAISNMMLNVLSSVAQMEREMMLERQAEGYAAAKAAGRIASRGNGKSVDRAGIVSALAAGGSVRKVAADFQVSTQTVQRIKREQEM
ncbi:recombinase family protein [Salmonella enterica]|nr:recombinase family protein [Salmonella enterica]EDR5032848.1 recombinase family protein [Salmonella enterica]EHR9955820.1 recombinase family protein [Salmonella enterica]EIF1022364.1 recombinase family protein [Salmonella enterica]EII3827885.1 recombinase family protein [Salmonella enterica]